MSDPITPTTPTTPKLPQDPRVTCPTCGQWNTDGHHHSGGEPVAGTGV